MVMNGAPSSGGTSPFPGFGGNQAPGGFGSGNRGFGSSGGLFGAGIAGPLRLFFGGELAGQWSWLFPLALVGLLAAVLSLRRKLPVERRGQALILWVGWLVSYGVIFSARRASSTPIIDHAGTTDRRAGGHRGAQLYGRRIVQAAGRRGCCPWP